jgi:K+-transporting ATPase ATPase C chain
MAVVLYWKGILIMIKNISRTALLIALAIGICCVLYPALLWGVGKVFFPFQAGGSVIYGPGKEPVGSELIAQPFTQDQYFQPRPSAASYNAAASASAALAASNYALRSRVASVLGPIVRYKSGPRAGQLVAPDIEHWFQKDTFGGAPSIVSQWATAHGGLAQAWVSADSSHARYVNKWAASHFLDVAQFVKQNPGTPKPGAADLAVAFFTSFSKENPGKFPGVVSQAGAAAAEMGPVNQGTDIQSTFFDMWRQDNPDIDLEAVPGDMVTTSASGLDPHITFENAEFQVDRVASKWAQLSHLDQTQVREQIRRILEANAFLPLRGLAGDKMINVLKVNIQLQRRFAPAL